MLSLADPMSLALVIGGNHLGAAPKYYSQRIQLQAMNTSLGKHGGTGIAPDCFTAAITMWELMLYSSGQPSAKEPQRFVTDFQVCMALPLAQQWAPACPLVLLYASPAVPGPLVLQYASQVSPSLNAGCTAQAPPVLQAQCRADPSTKQAA